MKHRQLLTNSSFIEQIADVIVDEIKGGVGSGIRGHRTPIPSKYSNEGRTGLVLNSNLGNQARKYVKEGMKLIEDKGLDITKVQRLQINQQSRQNVDGFFTQGVVRRNASTGELITRDPSITLGNKMSHKDFTFQHEFGHFVDWYLGGRQNDIKEGKLRTDDLYWSDKTFPKLGYNRKHTDCAELAADMFVKYIRTGSSKGIYVGGLDKNQLSALHNHFDSSMKNLSDGLKQKSHIPITKSKAKEDKFIKYTEKKEKEFQKVLNKYFIEQSGDISFSKDIGINSIIKVSKNRWFFNQKKWDSKLQKIGSDYIAELYSQYGSQVFEDLKYGYPNADILGAFDVTSPELEAFIDNYSYKFATGVNTITNDAIRSVMDYGMGEGLSNSNIAKVIRELFDGYTKYRSMLIARTETIRASNGAATEAYKQSGVVTGKQWWTARDDRRCPFCAKLHGKVIKLDDNFFNKGDSLTVGSGDNKVTMVFDYDDVGYPPAHPNCFIDWQVPIYTSKGYKPIGKIEVGDLVLTHKGRFRKVTKLIRNKAEVGTDIVDIQLMDKRHQHTTLTVTANHPVLLDGKWTMASDAKEGMFIRAFSNKCKRCGEEIPYWNKYCSHTCLSLDITDRQWADPAHRKNMSEKISKKNLEQYANGERDRYEATRKANEKTRQLVEEGNHIFQQEWVRENIRQTTNLQQHREASSKRMSENNPGSIPEVRARMTETFKKTLLEHPEKHPNFIMAQKGFISKPEKRMKRILDELGKEYQHQLPVRNYFVDFGLPDYKIAIEVDGIYWHQNCKEHDLMRQKEIEKEGWQVIRFTDQELKNKQEVKNELRRILANHDGEYSFMDYEIVKVNKWKTKGIRRQLYNFSVEEDESFIAKGFVVHNCRCTIIPLVASKYQLGISEYFAKAQGNFGHAGRPGRVGGSASRAGMVPYKHGDKLPEHLSHLKIPPAWTDVYVNPDPKAKVQVIGTDKKDRHPVLYSEEHNTTQARAKYQRVKEMDAKYDSIKKQNEANLKSDDGNIKEHAKVTRLIMETGIRPGSEANTGAEKKAYGATTLEGKHVVINGDKVSLQFVGKKGKDLNIPIDNKSIASDLIRRAKKAGNDGQLFPNTNDNSLRTYVKEFDGGGFKTKDFRTRLANDIAEKEIKKIKSPKTEKEYKKAVKEVAKVVSSKLGNTPAMALSSYINPGVFGGWQSRIGYASAGKMVGINTLLRLK